MVDSREVGARDIIRCERVNKKFISSTGVYEVVRGLDLSVKENEFVVLFGPGQCGKTTILNLLAGLELPSSGHITVDGQAVAGPDPSRGMVYQTTALFPWLTVMGNVEFGPKARGVGKEARRATAQKYIDLVGLQGFEKTFPVKLSGGMQQRVGIARAYSNDPVVILMDEPFGHLDAQTRYMMEEELEKIVSAEKRTVVFVTNNIEEAIYLADRILLLGNCPPTSPGNTWWIYHGPEITHRKPSSPCGRPSCRKWKRPGRRSTIWIKRNKPQRSRCRTSPSASVICWSWTTSPLMWRRGNSSALWDPRAAERRPF